ncbi:hypothetical protein [Nostoc sp. CMAA1605]|uniref:hypothetical protein n=1 Tax=Nostoc sp. CMAA1605 TaxID=2055159 RepID=UPI001F1ECCCC|nr:hypothetical protein [Nostoc sp. CMAA1605]
MTSRRSSSINRKSLLLCNLPNSLQETLDRVLQEHYEKLYEPEATASLEDALDDIFTSFQNYNPSLSHLRCVWMALILAVVVEPTVKYYQPDNCIPQVTIKQVAVWLITTITEMMNNKEQSVEAVRTIAENATVNHLQLLNTTKKMASFQILYEALDVYNNAIKALAPNQSLAAMIDILDDCLEGYAIFPGSDGRRELFEWWLLDVVPACWYLLPPSSIYSTGKSAYEKRIISRQIDKLNDISFALWTIISLAEKDKNKNYNAKNSGILTNSSHTFNIAFKKNLLDKNFDNNKYFINKHKTSIN